MRTTPSRAQTHGWAGRSTASASSGALFVAQCSGAAIAFRLAIVRPDLVRGLLSIDGGPAESAATPGMKKAFKFGGGLVKLAMDESKLRHDVRREIVRNSGDTTWVTDAVIRGYTAGQTADMHGSIDAFQQMSKSKEADSLADRLHECAVPVRLLVGTVPHPAEMTDDQRELLSAKLRDFKTDSVAGRASTSRRNSRPRCSPRWRAWTSRRPDDADLHRRRLPDGAGR